LARGDRTGALITRVPFPQKMPSNAAVKSGEYGTVGPVQSRTWDLPPQHRDLVAKNQNLRVLGRVAVHHEGKPAEQADYEQVDESDEHERRA
jgi:hypothetical protein